MSGVSRVYARDPEAYGGRILRPYLEEAGRQLHPQGVLVAHYDDPRLDQFERETLQRIGARLDRARCGKIRKIGGKLEAP